MSSQETESPCRDSKPEEVKIDEQQKLRVNLFQMVNALYADLSSNLKFRNKIMTALSDLQAASAAIIASLATLQASVTTLDGGVTKAIALLQGLQNGTINADDPAVAQVAADLVAAQTSVATAKATVDADAASLAAVAP